MFYTFCFYTHLFYDNLMILYSTVLYVVYTHVSHGIIYYIMVKFICVFRTIYTLYQQSGCHVNLLVPYANTCYIKSNRLLRCVFISCTWCANHHDVLCKHLRLCTNHFYGMWKHLLRKPICRTIGILCKHSLRICKCL